MRLYAPTVITQVPLLVHIKRDLMDLVGNVNIVSIQLLIQL